MRVAVLASLILPLTGWAQEAVVDPMAFTLTSGQTIHFESLEQRERFLAARERAARASAASPTPETSPAPSTLGHTGLDEHPAGTGTVNTGAPIFSADYYLLAPDTWVDKPLTLSIAYLKAPNEMARSDGLRTLTAHTYGILHSNGEQYPGGTIPILATTSAAERITRLCGSALQYNASGVKTTLIKGKLILIEPAGRGKRRYGIYVEQ